MKTFASRLLSLLTIFAAVPTGWAIYAGVIKHPAFPMNPICAILGAVGVVSTSIAAGQLVTDVKAFNQGLHNITEHNDFEMPTTPAWFIFGGCVLAEITLSLLIVVIPGALSFGVLVFPLMTAAGVFCFAYKYDLKDRQASLLFARAKSKPARKPKQVEKNLPQEPVKEEKLARKHVKDEDLLAYLASNAGASQQQVADFFGVTRQAIGPRIKKLYEVKQ